MGYFCPTIAGTNCSCLILGCLSLAEEAGGPSLLWEGRSPEEGNRLRPVMLWSYVGSHREGSDSHKSSQEDHSESTEKLILVLVQDHLEEQLWKTRTCLSLLRGNVVNRQAGVCREYRPAK